MDNAGGLSTELPLVHKGSHVLSSGRIGCLMEITTGARQRAHQQEEIEISAAVEISKKTSTLYFGGEDPEHVCQRQIGEGSVPHH